MTYIRRLRKPKVGSFLVVLRELSQEKTPDFGKPLKESGESERVRLPSSRRRASRQVSS